MEVKVPVFKPMSFIEWAIEHKKGKWKTCTFCDKKRSPDCSKCGGEVEYFEPYKTAPDLYRREISKLQLQWNKFHGVRSSEDDE